MEWARQHRGCHVRLGPWLGPWLLIDASCGGGELGQQHPLPWPAVRWRFSWRPQALHCGSARAAGGAQVGHTVLVSFLFSLWCLGCAFDCGMRCLWECGCSRAMLCDFSLVPVWAVHRQSGVPWRLFIFLGWSGLGVGSWSTWAILWLGRPHRLSAGGSGFLVGSTYDQMRE